MVVGVGIDVVDVPDFRDGLEGAGPEGAGPGQAGSTGPFLAEELAYARTQVRHWESLAARLAAKRAVLKALGAKSSAESAREVEIVRGDSGELGIRLHGEMLSLAERVGARGVRVSMSHTRSTALAFAVLEG